jgi:hypothetical protein
MESFDDDNLAFRSLKIFLIPFHVSQGTLDVLPRPDWLVGDGDENERF